MQRSKTHRGSIETYRQKSPGRFMNVSPSMSSDLAAMGAGTLSKTRLGAKEQIGKSMSPTYDQVQSRYHNYLIVALFTFSFPLCLVSSSAAFRSDDSFSPSTSTERYAPPWTAQQRTLSYIQSGSPGPRASAPASSSNGTS